jgi:CRP-like cAMP-binding protein
MAELLSSDEEAVLKQTAMFSALDDSALEEFLAGCRVLRQAPGSQIFRPTERAERFFVVLAGRVKIFKLSPRGEEQILHLYGSGETFGEAAMWANINYPAFADTLADTTLLAISRKTLRDAVARSPDLAMAMLAGLSEKLREFNRLIEQLSLKEVPARLAGVLLAEARKSGSNRIRLTQSKRELASQIGTVPETLSRALGKLKAGGLIEVKGPRITILDRDRLEDIAEGD